MTDTPAPITPDDVPDALFSEAIRVYGLAYAEAAGEPDTVRELMALRAAVAAALTRARAGSGCAPEVAVADESDPELLGPVEKIRHAEQLIRREHRIVDDDWLFWGRVADHLNDIAHVPELTSQRQRDWREFNHAQDMATGYIRMSRALLGEETS